MKVSEPFRANVVVVLPKMLFMGVLTNDTVPVALLKVTPTVEQTGALTPDVAVRMHI